MFLALVYLGKVRSTSVTQQHHGKSAENVAGDGSYQRAELGAKTERDGDSGSDDKEEGL